MHSQRWWSTLLLCVALSLVLLAWGCGSDSDTDTETPVDGDSDTATATDGDSDAASQDGDSEVTAQTLRCIKIAAAADAVKGPAAVGMVGDYLIANDKVRFVIQGESNRSRSWVPYTGSLVDADIVRADGEAGQDRLDELSPLTAYIRAFQAKTFEIVKDGSDGQSALLRVTGTDMGIPVVDMALNFTPMESTVVLEYELKPGDNALAITTTLTNTQSTTITSLSLGDGVVWDNRAVILTPGFGFSKDVLDMSIAFSEQYAEAPGIAYGIALKDGTYSMGLNPSDAGILPILASTTDLRAGRSASYTRYFIVGKDVETVRARVNDLRGVTTAPVTVTVTLADTQDANEAAEVRVLDSAGKPISQAYLPATTLTFNLKPGTYSLTTYQQGRPAATPVPLTVGSTALTAAITLPATGRVNFTVGGDSYDKTTKTGLPCRLSMQGGADAEAGASIVRRVFSATGSGTFLMEPGAYTLVASRGYEYEIVKKNVTVTAGQTISVTGTLSRSVDTTGWVAGDMHVHTADSIDAEVNPEDRVVQMAAVGLERGPNTEHDFVSGLDDLAVSQGVGDWLRLTVGCEISPPGYHTNMYPMVDNPARPRYFGAAYYKGYSATDNTFLGAMTFPEIWADATTNYSAQIRQINHPRDTQGYFNRIKYDPEKGVDALKPGVFSPDFDTLELINAARTDLGLDPGLADYFSFLNQGITPAAVGVSDSHVDGNIGDARTFIRTGVDNPRAIDDAALVAAIKAHRTEAASGPFVVATIGTAGIGDTYTNTKKEPALTLHVKIQAPTWMPVDWMKVYVNGTLAYSEDITAATVVRFDKDIPLTSPGKDYWVVIVTGAPDKNMGPVSPSQPVLTITSPIFVDVDGNGWTKPGLPAATAKRR